MAKRSLQDLQRQYSSLGQASAAPRGPMGGRHGPGGRGPGGRGPGGGKPRNTAKTVRRMIGYLSGYRVHLILVVLCMLLSTVTSLLGSFLLMPVINRIANKPMTAKDGIFAIKADQVIKALTEKPWISRWIDTGRLGAIMTYVAVALAIMLLIYLVGIVTSYAQNRLMVAVSQGAIERIRKDLFQKLQPLPVRYFDTHPTGEIMSRFTNDVDNIGTMLDNSLVSLISGTVTLIGTFLFMVTTSWILTLVTIAFVPLCVKGGAWIAGRSAKYYKGQQDALGAVNGYIEESVTGQKVIKVFGREETCIEEFTMLSDDLRDKQFFAQFYGGIMGPILGNASQISYAATVGIGGILMCTTGFTPGALTIFADYSKKFSMPINMIAQQMSTVFSALAGAERVFAVMDTPPEEPDAPDAQEWTEKRGDVELRNVTFGYVPEKTVLKDISLHALPGQKIAFVGSTGAGKTTVTNLISRFYDVNSGSILVDGKDIRSLHRAELRKNIAMVLQDTHLFTGTVMENIRYGRLDATDEEVIAAAKTASAHSFIMRLSDGYQTKIEGDGANLSQGQRQLLNIARAALSQAPILVLDEATSSVDTRTERHIEHGMDRLMKNRTTFVIAHRLSTVRSADKILVLEAGEIIERGNHEELLALHGRYYELYTGQRELD